LNFRCQGGLEMSAGSRRKKRPAPCPRSTSVKKLQKLPNSPREYSGNEEHSVSALLGLYGSEGVREKPQTNDDNANGAKTRASDSHTPQERTDGTEMKVLLEQLEKARPDTNLRSQNNSIPGDLANSKKPPFQCLVCTRCFIRMDHLKKHALTHSKDKNVYTKSASRPHECSYCGKCFRRREHMTIHLRIHTGEKPYACSSCEKKFATKMALTSHSRTHTGEKPYQCRECGNRFAHSSHLKSHMRTHTGELPYRCKTCSKGFSQSSALKQHMRTHTGERPHACRYCPKRFTTRSALTCHTRTHTGERPYKCTSCNKSFVQSTHLTSHLKTVHKIVAAKKPQRGRPSSWQAQGFRSLLVNAVVDNSPKPETSST